MRHELPKGHHGLKPDDSVCLEKLVPLDVSIEQEGETEGLPALTQGIVLDLRLLLPC